MLTHHDETPAPSGAGVSRVWGAPFPTAPAGPPRRRLGPARFAFEDLEPPDDDDLVALGGDLSPRTLVAAYAAGYFPMGVGGGGAGPVGWWAPQDRGVLVPADVHVSRSLARSMRRFEVRVDTAFDEVVQRCADPSRPGAWITAEVARAYGRLHRLGWAHSVEVWADGELAGGLYGVSVGGLFAAESKFHRVTDASKAAVVALADLLVADGVRGRLVDVQWRTEHLATLGVQEVPRGRYLRSLAVARELPVPPVFSARPDRPTDYDGG